LPITTTFVRYTLGIINAIIIIIIILLTQNSDWRKGLKTTLTCVSNAKTTMQYSQW